MYIIIDRVSNEVLYFNDKIDLGFGLDNILINYDRYDLKLKVSYYNNYNVVSIRLLKD